MNPSMKMNELGVSILSWGRHDKLKTSLESYKNNDLFDLVGDANIFFNEHKPEDEKLAGQYPLRLDGNNQNVGIGWGMVFSVMLSHAPYVLFLENDFELAATKEETYNQLSLGLDFIKQGNLDIVKYRRLDNYKTTCNETKNWYDRGERWGCAEENWHVGFTADDDFGNNNRDICNLLSIGDVELWGMSSENAGWSNNPFMCKREWFLEFAESVGFNVNNFLVDSLKNVNTLDFEQQIKDKWIEKGANVGIINPALFNHQ